MVNEEKEVRFDKWCPKCENEKLTERDEPCSECLCVPVNLHTDKPIKYKEKGTRK